MFDGCKSRKRVFSMSMASIVLIWLAMIMAGCASGPEPTSKLEDIVKKQSSKQADIKQLNDTLFSSVASSPTFEDYVLGEGDLVQVTVFEVEELSTVARVSARGNLTLPLLGPVEVKGMTTRETEQKIEDLYREKYLQDPKVTLFIKEQYSSKITLLGSLQKPGTYDYPSRQRLLGVLAMAGGLSEDAGMMVQVRREDKETNHPKTFLVDMDQMIKKGQDELNIQILGGDVIFVPEADQVFVNGAVRKPGNYSIKKNMTIHEAIVSAGGFSSYADESHIKLIRRLENGEREVVLVDNRSTSATASAGGLSLQDRDVVFVETNTAEAIIYGLRLNLGGLVGFGYTPPDDR